MAYSYISGRDMQRHNRVLDFVAKQARKHGYEVRVEERIPTPAGIRIPDLVIYKPGARAMLLDVTIVADNAVLSRSHSLKVKYYDVK